MKSFLSILPAATLFGATLGQWLPSCSWSDCKGDWDGWSCDKSNGWDCLCSNTTAISQINSCVASSCTNATDQQAIYGAIAQLCVNHGQPVTNSEEATFSATSGGTLLPTITGGPGWGPGGGWNGDSWSSWVSSCSSAFGGGPSGWRSGHGPWGNGGPQATNVPCDGPWTSWTSGWGPHSSWTGIWSACSTKTASPEPATVTTTINGSVVVGTTFGVQALSATSTTGASGTNAAPSIFSTSKVMGVSGSLAAAIFALMIAL